MKILVFRFQYNLQICTEVSVSVLNLKNTAKVSVSVRRKNSSISIQYQYPCMGKKEANQANLKKKSEVNQSEVKSLE